MHYGDKRQLNENILKVVFYKHEVICDKECLNSYKNNIQKYAIQLTSIQECQYISPHQLKHFLEAYNYLLKDEFEVLSYENFYLFIIRFIGYEYEDFEVLDIQNVSKSDNDFLTLH